MERKAYRVLLALMGLMERKAYRVFPVLMEPMGLMAPTGLMGQMEPVAQLLGQRFHVRMGQALMYRVLPVLMGSVYRVLKAHRGLPDQKVQMVRMGLEY